MEFKTRLNRVFKNRILKPQLKRMDAWEKIVIDDPDSVRGGENSPVRFNIPREGIKLEGDHPPLPGIPGSVPQMIGSMINIRRSVLDLERNPTDGKRQMDARTMDEMREFARSVGADDTGFAPVPQEWVFQDTAIRCGVEMVTQGRRYSVTNWATTCVLRWRCDSQSVASWEPPSESAGNWEDVMFQAIASVLL